MHSTIAVQAAIAFTWLGMVLAISFLETPLKFRAPGMTIALGVGIGRLVFRALNLIEAVFVVTLLVTLFWTPDRIAAIVLIAVVALLLAGGALVLRPIMDAKVRRGETSDRQPRHLLHIGYIVLETIKIVLLAVLGVMALATLAG